jgi:nitrite reductase/ring-hydroxylating ferredoxin subunit
MGAVAALIFAFPFIAFLFGTPRRKSEWFRLGPVKSFPLGETRTVTFDNPLRQPWDGESAHTAVYVRNEGKDKEGKDQFLVLSVNCAHLGCPVSWFKEAGLFMCPCHGGVYYADGERASGPPPRGLFRCEWRVEDGHLEIMPPFYPSLQKPLDPKNAARRTPDGDCGRLALRVRGSTSRPGEDRA